MTLDYRMIPQLLTLAAVSLTVACASQDSTDGSAGAVDDGADDAVTSDDGDTLPTGPGPCLGSVAPDEPAFALDFGDWAPALDIDQQGGWSGPCTVASVEVEDGWTTTLDCSADPQGPPQIVASFRGNMGEVAWAADDVLDIVYVRDDWSNGERLIARNNTDAGLLFALIDGGGDGGLPLHDEEITPISVQYDLEYCEGDPSPAPVLVDFAEPGGSVVSLFHGSGSLLALDDGQEFGIYLRQAVTGDLDDHYGSFVDVAIYRSLL